MSLDHCVLLSPVVSCAVQYAEREARFGPVGGAGSGGGVERAEEPRSAEGAREREIKIEAR